MSRCFECKYIDFKTPVEKRMKYWGLCKKGKTAEEQSRFLGPASNCNKRGFSKATPKQIQDRLEWLEKGKDSA